MSHNHAHLTAEEIDFLLELVLEYEEERDLSQPAWAEVRALRDKLDELWVEADASVSQ